VNIPFLGILFLLWGSFLNVLGFRLIKEQSVVLPRSYCPQCSHPIAWYDNIPVLSWLLLRGRCRSCKEPISWLYPFIELLTAGSLLLLVLYIPQTYLPAYLLFFSALIVTIRSDLETMLISRYVTLFLIPFGLLCAHMAWLPITLTQSILGTLLGYALLYTVAQLFYLVTKKHGLGQGDLELMAFIGAFTGPEGIWITLLIGSWVGTLIGLFYIWYHQKSMQIKLPFGPFLALGAMTYALLQEHIQQFLMYY